MASNDYSKITAPYDPLLNRQNDLTLPLGQDSGQSGYTQGANDGTVQTPGGSVSTVALKSEGNAGDIWIQNFIRSLNWKPKTVGFYVNGQTGYAEFANVYVSGTLVSTSGTFGGFKIGTDYIRDTNNTMGLASTVTGADDVRFWAGDTFINRSTAPFRVTESGQLFANNVVITGGTISGGAIAPGSVGYAELTYPPLSGITDPTTTPGAIGQLYVNTALARCFMAVGTNSDADWVLLATAGSTRTKSFSDSVVVSESVTVKVIYQLSKFDSVTVAENFAATIV